MGKRPSTCDMQSEQKIWTFADTCLWTVTTTFNEIDDDQLCPGRVHGYQSTWPSFLRTVLDIPWIFFSNTLDLITSDDQCPSFATLAPYGYWRSIKPAWKLDRRGKNKVQPWKMLWMRQARNSDVCVPLSLFWLDSHYCSGNQSPCPPCRGRILGVVWQDGIRNPHFMPIPPLTESQIVGRQGGVHWYVPFSFSYFSNANSPVLKQIWTGLGLTLRLKLPTQFQVMF